MYLKELYVEGFKSFGKPTTLSFPTRITGIVGPNGSGKSNVTEAFRFVLGEQSMKSLRGRRGKDLIFNGGSGPSAARRAIVRIVFSDPNHVLNDAFDQVSVSRTVHQDGANEYNINDIQVRHRDVVALFARANIGATGHHIISQGEADRILNASPDERKEMLEDGLGLKLLQYRRNEAEKKLKRAEQHVAETELLLKEITPHMRHLKRQVDRYEQARTVRKELESLYAEYIAREVGYLSAQKKILEEQEHGAKSRLKESEKKLSSKKQQMTGTVADKLADQMRTLQERLVVLREKKDTAARSLGRLEGEERILADTTTDSEQGSIDREQVAALHEEVKQRSTATTEGKQADLISYIIDRLGAILIGTTSSAAPQKRLLQVQKDRVALQDTLRTLEREEQQYTGELDTIRSKQQQNISDIQASEQLLMQLMTEKNTADKALATVQHTLEIFHADEEHLQREIKEGTVLIGAGIQGYLETSVPQDAKTEPRKKQKERQHLLERKKIQLETMGTDSGEEVYDEYKEVTDRITFLNKERDDIVASIVDCRECIDRIQREIDTRFREGTKKISAEFDSFFRILFGGGHASLAIEKQEIVQNDEDTDEVTDHKIGVAVKVSLPRKKIRSLEQLSGGERALVSIALLFAISQVTPPPFLVLDETDAALDEANSRRYVSMIKALAKRSQLILVTHNRETMHCAGALYGVTMNSTGASTLLSVQFDEAVQVAK